MVRIGFIGCGNHATNNLYPSLRFADCQLVSVCDPNAERREVARRVFGAQSAYASYEEMLAKEDLQAVFVVGPPLLHYQAAIYAMQHALHVFTEKPPAETLAQTEEMLAVSRQTGRFLSMGFMKRFAQKYVLADQLSRQAEFGRRTHLSLRYSYNWDGQRQAMLMYMCIHAIDLVRHFMGDIAQVQVETGLLDKTSNLSLNLLFTNGSSGTIVMNNNCPGVLERLELTGEGAFLVVDEVETLSYYPPQADPWKPPVRHVYQPNTALQTTDNLSLELQGYVGEVIAFIDGVKNNQPPRLGTIEDGVAAMRLIDLLLKNPRGTFKVN